ncbi:DUF47 family protein [Vagococcus lutrae]|uniref:DUF47 domain-containing protein n=1 Tax=Vagococcus lutrae TaxID=81947 RepID=UPI001C98C463|nr:DUF47 family protein [Vagococcus lutrae]QZN88428.1 DUF47 family protein [Vagococcus lutrae]
MARKKEFNYFDALTQLASKGYEAARVLEDIILNYNYETIAARAKEIHVIENEGDELVHTIMDELNRSFITPIDREDIVAITEDLDDILDGINSLPYLFDSYLIKELRPKTEMISHYILEATESVCVVTKEFSKFKNSTTLGTMIAQVNDIEEKTDDLYRSLIKDLFTHETDPLEVIKWKSVYERFERIINATEKTADNLAGLVIKNT